MSSSGSSIFPPGVCESPTREGEIRDRRILSTETAYGPPSNIVQFADSHFTWNRQNVRVAMTEKRIRIGCTEVSIEAAREIMQQHGLRFGKPAEEVWQEVQ